VGSDVTVDDVELGGAVVLVVEVVLVLLVGGDGTLPPSFVIVHPRVFTK